MILFIIILVLMFVPFIVVVVLIIRNFITKLKPSAQTTSTFQGYAQRHGFTYSPNMDIRLVKGTMHTFSVMQKASNHIALPINGTNGSLFNLNFVAQVHEVDAASDTGGDFVNYPIFLTVLEVPATVALPNLLLLNNYFVRYQLVPRPFTPADKFSLEGNEFARSFVLYAQQQGPSLFELFPPDVMAQLIDHYANISIQFNNNVISFYQPGDLASNQDLQTFIDLCTAFMTKLKS